MFKKTKFKKSTLIIVPIEKERYKRACSERFHLLQSCRKTRTKIFLLGSTANFYIINVTPTSMTCNCPDKNKACKHVLFVLRLVGFIKNWCSWVNIQPSKIIPLLWHAPLRPAVQECLLDSHVNALCLPPKNASCLYCRNATNQPIIICSKCGYLCHRLCFFAHHKMGSKCPRCHREFYALQTTIENNYYNYLNVLDHFGYMTSSSLHEPYDSGKIACNLRPYPDMLPLNRLPNQPPSNLSVFLHDRYVHSNPIRNPSAPPELILPPRPENVSSSTNTIPALMHEL